MSFGKFETAVVPSQFGEVFTVNTPVMFKVENSLQTGTITKQLKNPVVVEIDETAENQQLMLHSNSVLIVNFTYF